MSGATPRASWDSEKDEFLIQAMIDQARAGKRSDSGFKKEAWASVTKDINERFGLELVKQQIKSRLQTLKGKYTAVSGMLSASGFGWDSSRNVVLVHDDVWNDYVKGHPKCVDYRRTSLSYYDNLVELFECTYATGEHAITSDEPSTNDFAAASEDLAANLQSSLMNSSNEASTEEPIATTATEASAESQRQTCGNQQPNTEPNSNKRTRESGGAMIAGAIREMVIEMHERNVRLKTVPPSQKAVKILQKACGNRFSADKMTEAIDVMLDEHKAVLFVALVEGEVRDLLLDNQLQATE